ncbi:MFS transporter [Nocardiopsis dassonvillei]|uniref:Major facilitator superfamily MFS_1 n=1 Tax=Nocardiopsis dassonvillei (strain ATCC 23218 / DSM 43111 / CIP 107115 / JCM 7437 / KCTC 9190 / NBRC 14626 / NCTC 10488 / NRRL B-5397 / IMRU 509) TaxID=446468 RepID=D7B2G6_NOCDD|nr:MFS transporter [Nocardiopsis dassonvillei]ADH68623.1 major facilitator superfamily MFS_1 [Nocardiopsis dassonvillei subsp. dassonvillei DSM 43111]NKY78524.1 MFS transporter [Nocardiopsis dassonvillei]VEI89132.1 Multidrug-efflux transporter 3 [Nocardiopsis dassonvillei]
MTRTSTAGPATRALIPVLAFTGIVVSVMQTMLIPLIKDLPQLLGTEPHNATWVITSTLLSGAVATPVMGRLGDLHGKRRMLILSLAVMVVGALVSAVTDDPLVMITGRALQGFAMSAIPLSISLARDIVPREELGSAMALISSSMGVGGSLALPASGLVAQHADWHALFYGAAGLGLLCIALILIVVPESPVSTHGTFDLLGAVGLSAALTLFLLPVTKGSHWGWTSSTTLGLFTAAVVVLILWGVLELRLDAPLVDLHTMARPAVLFTNLASIMVGASYLVVSMVLPQLLQLPKATGYGLGQSMVTAGLYLAPLGLTMMLTAPIYARLSARHGPKSTLILGMSIVAIGYGVGLSLMNAPWQSLIITAVLGVGIGLAYSSLPALIVGVVPATQTGSANGLNTLMRSIGSSLSSAVIGGILSTTAHQFNGVPVPSMCGFRISFLIATSAMAIGLFTALFLPGPARSAGAPHRRRANPRPVAHAREVTGGPASTGE